MGALAGFPVIVGRAASGNGIRGHGAAQGFHGFEILNAQVVVGLPQALGRRTDQILRRFLPCSGEGEPQVQVPAQALPPGLRLQAPGGGLKGSQFSRLAPEA